MHQYIINKIEYTNGSVQHTAIGYTTSEIDRDSINADHDSTLGDWVNTNIADLENNTKSISEFFASTPTVHIAKTTVNYDSELIEITDINSL